MKPRIQIDVLFLFIAILLIIGMMFFPRLYPQNPVLDDALDFLGVILVLKGLFLRMIGRGHKKKFSRAGMGLVTSGPYTIIRNPMYLGTYLIFIGFTVMLCPLWGSIIFSVLFYLRFRRQIRKEEAHLKRLFGEEYTKYCERTPAFFPRITLWINYKMNDVFPWDELWLTKEKQTVIPILAGLVVCETIKEWAVYRTVDVGITFFIIGLAVAVFSAGLWVRYKTR